MKLDKLRLKGFTGIKKGLGLNEVELDLSKLNGLVSLSGPNGFGKTTVLESMSPFAEFVSRKENHLADNVFSRNAEKELCFYYKGHYYRTLIKIDCQTRNLEGYIFKDNEPQVNGKISEYKKYINDLVGSQALFYNSIFTAQNSESISEMKESSLRSLFREFVGADQLEAKSKTASEVSKHYKNELNLYQKELSIYDDIQHKLDMAVLDRGAKMIKLSTSEKSIEESESEIRKLKSNLSFLNHELNRAQINQQKIDMINKQIDEKEVEKKNLLNEIAGKLSALDIEKSELQAKIKTNERALISIAAVDIFKEELRECSQKIETENENIQDEEEFFSKITLCKESIENKLKVLQPANNIMFVNIQELRTQYSDLKNALKTRTKDLESLSDQCGIPHLNSMIKSLEKQTELLRKKPEDCVNSECEFIKSALNADIELKSVRENLTLNLKKYNELKVDLESKISTLVENIADLNHKGQVLSKTKEFSDSEIEDHADELSFFSENINECNKRIKSAKDNIKKLKETSERIQTEIDSLNPKLLDALRSENKEFENDIQQILKQKCTLSNEQFLKSKLFFNKIQELKREIKALPEYNLTKIKSDISATEEFIEIAENTLAKSIGLKNDMQAEIKALNINIKDYEQQLAKKTEVESKIKDIGNKISIWEYLKIVTGPKGLQAVEIDGVVPLIVEITNNLLSLSFGPDFSININMQDQETGKEIFEIIVIDNQGEESKLGQKSGGESVWLLKAIRLAMCLISKEKSGHVFETAFSDEETGALDPQKSEDLIKLYRSFMSLGGFSTKFFISHSENITALADHHIIFSKGKIQIQ